MRPGRETREGRRRRRLRILYLAPVFPPEQSGGATHVYELAREWVRLGQRVTVTKGFPHHPTGRVPERYRGSLHARECVDGIEVLYSWLYATPNSRGHGLRYVLGRALSYLTGALGPLVLALALRRRYDVIIGTCPHIFLVVAAFVMSAITGTPYVFEVRDQWPRQIADLGLMRRGWLYRLLERIELVLYRRSRLVITVTHGAREDIVSRGVAPGKVIVVPNGADCRHFRPLTREGPDEAVLRRALGLDGPSPRPTDSPPRRRGRHVAVGTRAVESWRLGGGGRSGGNAGGCFVVGYFGTFGLSQGLSVIMDAARELASDPETVFILAGDGAEREELLGLRDRDGLDNVRIIPPLPRECMPSAYAACDCCVVPLRRTELFRRTVPSKVYEIMACGSPVALGVDGEARRVVVGAGAGVFFEPEDGRALARVLAELKADPGRRVRLGQAGVRTARRLYDRRALAREALAAIEKAARPGAAFSRARGVSRSARPAAKLARRGLEPARHSASVAEPQRAG
jgi:glycosyltransferase involved in cell wall biosynthesis